MKTLKNEGESMNEPYFKREGRVITLILPDIPANNLSGTEKCSICGSEGTKKAPVRPINTDIPQYKLIVDRLTDHNMLCSRCVHSISALSNRIRDAAWEAKPKIHTASLVSVSIPTLRNMRIAYLKPNAPETMGIKNGSTLNFDPFECYDSYNGWEKFEQIYKEHLLKEEEQDDELFEQSIIEVTEDGKLVDKIAADFTVNLIERLQREKKSTD
ncbi:hypothetical protein [Aquamicrobium sp.]|uniref:hypothetical protein n=1 Tax=Aquamicrobium sp. TaxID=1872579 RepID=UPI00258FAE1A|nr:hypothetical protein [Aquamicrobium sp.]MCK9549474.1 hypothetical protein [Aquamicrobium sp.]